MNRLFKTLLYLGLSYFFYLMILITLQYVPIDYNAAFLNVKQVEIQKPYYQIAFFTHVYTSIFALLFGFFQFSNTIRRKYLSFHRFLGKGYVGIILLLAGPSGLIIGYHGNGGISSQISFCVLAVLWMYFSYKAFLHAKRKEIILHKKFIYRSYALTLSAISLRLFKWLIVGIFELPPMDTYQIVSWLGWTVNLFIAEAIIYYSLKK